MTTISLKNLVKKFGDDEVVHSINLEIKEAEFIVLVGPSGCGKSTTLRMIAGLEEITGGEIVIGDRVVNNILPKDRNIAMVFQSYALYPHMNVFNNMSFALKLQKVPKLEIKERVDNAARILNIEELLNRRPSELSGGQRQRVALARGLFRSGDLLILDDVLSAVDHQTEAQLVETVAGLAARPEAPTVLISSHRLSALRQCDTVLVLDGGRLVDSGPHNELVARPGLYQETWLVQSQRAAAEGDEVAS